MATPQEIEQRQRRELVARARAKTQRGETLTAKELAAWKRFEAELEERYGAQWAARVPQRVYREWAGGRQTKQLADHERAYGVPCTGRTIDLAAVVRWLHGFLVERKEELRSVGAAESGSLKDQQTRAALEKLRLQVEKLQDERELAAGATAPVAELEAWLAKKAQTLRSLAAWMAKQKTITGEEAARRLRLAIESAEMEGERRA